MLFFSGSSSSVFATPMHGLPDDAETTDRAPADEPGDAPISSTADTASLTPDELFQRVHEQLRAIAAAHMRSQASDHTLQTTGLVSEAYLRLVRSDARFEDRAHYLRVASRAMRQILVDHARRRAAGKRAPANRRVPLDDVVDQLEERTQGLESVDAALAKLEDVHPELALLVEMHMFGGQPMRVCAEALGVNERTAFRRWETARRFLYLAIKGEQER